MNNLENNNELDGPQFEVKNEIHVKPERKKRGPYMTRRKKIELGLPINEPTTAQPTTSAKIFPPSNKIDFAELANTYESNLDGEGGEGGEVIEANNQLNGNPAINVTGDMLLALIDTIAPIIAMIGVKVITKGKKKIKIASMRLTAEEKEILQSSADAAAAEILGNLTPVQLFLFTLVSIYGGKIIEQMAIDK